MKRWEVPSMTRMDPVYCNEINATSLERALGPDVTYQNLVANFQIPQVFEYNMAADTVDRQAAGSRRDHPALICEQDGGVSQYSFDDLSRLSNRFAAFLCSRGVGKGDVVACYCGQGLESALTHLAAYKLGAIAAPLSQLYGPDAIAHVLQDCSAKAIVTERDLWQRVTEGGIGNSEPGLVVVSGGIVEGQVAFEEAIQFDDADFTVEKTHANDPALLLYTSGSTGMPKGILHRQRLLLGYLASVSLFYELDMDRPNQVLWTVSDWSWVAGIFNVMLTGWYFGHTVVAGPTRFTPEWAFEFMEKYKVTHCFLTPTALKRMAAISNPNAQWPQLAIRVIGTGGEPLPSSVLDWADRELDIPINEFYGLTEVNHLIGNCRKLWPIKPGSMGRPYPGHTIVILDESGKPVPDRTVGEISVRDDDPTLLLGYWQQPERIQTMKTGQWVRTGDFGHRDADGYFWYEGRRDDLIKSAGYRIGPAEIEDTLVQHKAVEEAAVIGVPDAERGQSVKAFVRLMDHGTAGADLVRTLQDHVKNRLAFHKYPRQIEFVESFPLTSTGKINRKELKKREADKQN